MKKVLALALTLVLVLSLAACGGGKEGKADETKATTYNIGDTAEGSLCNITIKSFDYIDKIEKGLHRHVWSPTTMDGYEDVTAKEGYSIVKIDYSFEFKGKEKGDLVFHMALDYDGYIYDGYKDLIEPELIQNGVGFEEEYTFLKIYFPVDDPLSYKGETSVFYLVVNNEVKTNTSVPLLLKVNVPTSMYHDGVSTTEDETFVYKVR